MGHNQNEPTPEHRWRVMDATRRVMYNRDMFLSSAPFGQRSLDKVKEYNFANYLSSVYSLQDVVRAYSKAYAPPGYYNSLENAVRSDELLNYIREARISQDHTLNPSATQPIVGFGFDVSGKIIGTQRGQFQLYPLISGRGKGTIPVPTSHRGQPLQNLTPELATTLSAQWWFDAVDNLDISYRAKIPFALPG